MGRHTQIGGDFLEVFTLIGRVGLEGAGEVEDNLKNIEDGADNTSSKFENLMDKTDKLGRGMTKFVTGPIAAAAAGIAGLAYQAGQYADGILDTSSATGLATDTIQEYQAVAEVAGVNTQVLVRAQEMLTRQMARSEGGSARLTRAVENLSISYQELEDTSPEQRVMLLAEELGKIPDAAQRAETGMMLFGGAWRDLAPIIDLGTENIEKFRERAQEVGYVMSGEGLNAANDYRIELVLLRQQFTGMWRELQQKIIPILNEKLVPTVRDELVPAFENFGNKILDLIEWFAELDPKVQSMLIGFTGIAAAVGPIAIVLPQIVTSIQMLGSAAAFLGPGGFLLVGLGAMVTLFFQAREQVQLLEADVRSLTKAELERRREAREAEIERLEADLEASQKRQGTTRESIIGEPTKRDLNRRQIKQAKEDLADVTEQINKLEEAEQKVADIKEPDLSWLEELTGEDGDGGEINVEGPTEYEQFINNLNKQIEDYEFEQRLDEISKDYLKEVERLERELSEKISLVNSFDISDEEKERVIGTLEQFYNNQVANVISEATEEYEQQQEEKRQRELAAEQRHQDEIMQNRFKMNDISEREYRRYLRERLADYEEYTDEWTRVRQRIDDTLESDSDPNDFSQNLARLGRMGRNAASGGTTESEEQEISDFLQGIQQAHKDTTEQIQTFWRDTGQLLYNETNNLFAKTLKDAENFKDHFDNFMETMADNALNQLARIATNKLFTTFLPGIPFAEGGVGKGGFSLFANGGMVSGAVNAVIGEGKDDEVVMPLNKGVFSNLASSITDEMGDKTINNQGETNINVYQVDGANDQATVNGVRRNPEVVKQIMVDSVKNNSEVREMLKRFL